MKYKLLIALLTVNSVLVALSGTDQGRMSFLTIPLLVLFNLVLTIYGFSKKNRKVGFTALVLLFVAPIVSFIIFVNVFPFLTR